MLVCVSITLAIVSAVLYGVWKFGIGQYRGRISPYAIVLVTTSVGTVIYLISSWRTDAMTFSPKDVLPGTVAGPGLAPRHASGSRGPQSQAGGRCRTGCDEGVRPVPRIDRRTQTTYHQAPARECDEGV